MIFSTKRKRAPHLSQNMLHMPDIPMPEVKPPMPFDVVTANEFEPYCRDCQYIDVEISNSTCYSDNRVRAITIGVGCSHGGQCRQLNKRFSEEGR